MRRRRGPDETPFQRRFRRWVAFGTWTARHWRGLLMSLYLGLLAVDAWLAWVGYRHRARGWGVLMLFVFGLSSVWLLLRFPTRLTRSMLRRRGSRGRTPPTVVYDVDARDTRNGHEDRPQIGD